ncbi:MAG: multiheme c-type cytochrome [Salinibacter sp.]|uniref:multiheme c-type cytochrome n=1 Tax=Salinibacter sp. TaxID=2065818 RepID=UPI0035D49581
MRLPVPTSRIWPLVAAGPLCVLGVGVAVAMLMPQEEDDLSDSPYLRIDPEKILIRQENPRVPCGQCHTLEYQVWKKTEHATGYSQLHRSEQAQNILDRMGFRTARRNTLCLRCHYTAKIKEGEPRAVAGVSCESCHGAARDWIDIHNNYGQYTHETEPKAHRKNRIRRSVKNGMLRPSGNLYAVAANCFECHTVPQEKLINTGGHPSGSNFELVAWTDSIRHNFLEAQWSDDRTNDKRSPERKRIMYVIGRALDYEYSIRGLAKAGSPSIYAKAMEDRIKSAHNELRKILHLVDISEIKQIIEVGNRTDFAPGNKEELVAAADTMRMLSKQFEDEYDGSTLEEIDPLIAGEDVKLPSPSSFGPTTETDTSAEDTTQSDQPPSTKIKTSEKSLPELPGEVQSRPAWFPESEFEVKGPQGCSCHIDQRKWWNKDAHYTSADPLLNESRKAVQIATLYGLSPSQMKRGDTMCMNCHGTALSGQESSQVFHGVSCESCHGPGGEYAGTDAHENYADGASLGMKRLDMASVRAQNCARCHHITDKRLLAAGHPTGQGFTLSERNERIKHWDNSDALSASALDDAFRQIVGSRPIPEVEVVEPPKLATSDGASEPSQPSADEEASAQPAPPPQTRTRPAARSAVPPPRSVPSFTLPAFPEVSDSTSVDSLLLLLKQRLELLHQKVEGN